jgi:hypothetical protein
MAQKLARKILLSTDFIHLVSAGGIEESFFTADRSLP